MIRILLAWAMATRLLTSTACTRSRSGGSGDGDGDADGDTDGDAGTDGDADTDADGDADPGACEDCDCPCPDWGNIEGVFTGVVSGQFFDEAAAGNMQLTLPASCEAPYAPVTYFFMETGGEPQVVAEEVTGTLDCFGNFSADATGNTGGRPWSLSLAAQFEPATGFTGGTWVVGRAGEGDWTATE